MSGLILDTGALIGIERNLRSVVTLIERARQRGDSVIVPAGCLAQAWRNGTTQVRLATLLRQRATQVRAFDDEAARRAGELLAVTGTADVVDAHVALLAIRTRSAVLTSDPHDIQRLAPMAIVKAI